MLQITCHHASAFEHGRAELAKVEFNVAWWKKNSAKTLTDTGMSEALRVWEGAKKVEADPTIAALTTLHKAAVAAEKKANKTIHKETITYLKPYQDMCVSFVGKLKKADGSSMASFDKILTKPMVLAIGDNQKGKFFLNELLYLLMTKGNEKVASEAIYKTFIKAGAPKEVNISGPERAKCDQLATAKTWDDEGWKVARDEVVGITLTQANLKNIQKEVLGPIEAEPVLKEIRAA